MRQTIIKCLPHILFKKAWIIMEFKFSDLKQKEVINLTDGKHLGKVCDLSFTFPENNVLGFYVTGCKGFRFSRQEQFIPVKCVTKIGEDAILVKIDGGKPPKPDCPPNDRRGNCRPDCPPPNCPPQNFCPPEPNGFYENRRSLDEYE